MGRIVGGVFLLNLLGFLMDMTWHQGADQPGYLSYGIKFLNGLPYWLFATLTYLGLNGVAAIYFAFLRGNITLARDTGEYQGELALPQIRLLGINLVLIPLLLTLFILMRAIGL